VIVHPRSLYADNGVKKQYGCWGTPPRPSHSAAATAPNGGVETPVVHDRWCRDKVWPPWMRRACTGGRYGCKGGAVVELEAVRTMVVAGDTCILLHTSDLAGHQGITEAVCGVGAWRSVSNKVSWEASLVVFSCQVRAPLLFLLGLASDMFWTSPLCQ
jgi:hypothetical protein